MKKKDREILELRQKTLGLYDIFSQISQFSWRIKRTKDSYSLDDTVDVYYQYWELLRILKDYIEYTDRETPNIKKSYLEYSKLLEDIKREVEDEN